jgi:hypothetical protein
VHRAWSSRAPDFPPSHLPQFLIHKFHFFLLQNRRAVSRAIDQIGKMVLQRFGIAVLDDVFEDFNYD